MPNVNIAANEKAFKKIIIAAAKKLQSTPPLTGNGSLGPFSASYKIGFKITDGDIDLTSTGRVHIKELDITYDPMILTLGIDLPHIHIGGECIIPNPFPWGPDCLLRLPEIDIWGSNPDITIPIDLSGYIVSEFSGEFSVNTSKQVLLAKGGRTIHQAHFDADTSNEIRDRFRTTVSSALPLLPAAAVNGIADSFVPFVKSNLADKWQLFLHDHWHDLDIVDVADTAGNILRGLSDLIIDKILSPVPSILRGIVRSMIGWVIDLIVAALDIPDDIMEWLSSVFQTSFGLLDLIAQLIINFIGSMVPFYQFETPYPMIEDTSGLIPVLVPVENLGIVINDQEFIVQADIL
jgi:hypothetical protein